MLKFPNYVGNLLQMFRIHLTTWNVANIDAIGTGPLAKMFDIDRSVDIYVIR